MHDSALSRRDFLGVSGTAATGLALTSPAAIFARRAGGNDRLSIGVVGTGDRGLHLLKIFFGLGQDARAEVTAVCDLWQRNRERGAQQVKDATSREPRQFKYLEEMLAAKDLDAVILATPD